MADERATPEGSEGAAGGSRAGASASDTSRPDPRAAMLIGGAKPKLIRGRAKAWPKGAEEIFFETLAETCNITLASAQAGVRPARAYERRQRDAAFRRAWGEALATGYARLELMLLQRSLDGTEKLVRLKDGSEERVREYPNQIALALLKMHRDSVREFEAEHSEEEVTELRERILAKLARLKARAGA